MLLQLVELRRLAVALAVLLALVWVPGCGGAEAPAKKPVAKKAKKKTRATAGAKAKPKDADALTPEVTSSIGLKLKLIPAGEFQMGSPASDAAAYDNEKPQQPVKLTRPFYLATTEITQGQWQAVMGTTPWKGQEFVKEGPNYAATFVNWEDAHAFCKKLGEKEGVVYRLPSEAEWEYACRAGTSTRYSFGEDASKLNDYAWAGAVIGDDKAPGERNAQEVGKKQPNAFGLFDMLGNVAEWCEDAYREKLPGGTDPLMDVPDEDPVFRGGAWDTEAKDCRVALRVWSAPTDKFYQVGFRIARAAVDESSRSSANIAKTPADMPVKPGKESVSPDGKKLTNSFQMPFVLIPAGEFEMGSPDSFTEANYTEVPSQHVKISHPFYLGTTEVTQGQWEAVMGSAPWRRKEYSKEGPNFAAAFISWEDGQAFCKTLGEKDGATYRLPTDAEWEYACRGGTTTKYSFGDDPAKINDYAWAGMVVGDGRPNPEFYPHEVGLKLPNPFGLFDMHGNVSEWTGDKFIHKLRGGTDPFVPPGAPQVGSWEAQFRGGAWAHSVDDCRSARRRWFPRGNRDDCVGFRVVRIPPGTPQVAEATKPAAKSSKKPEDYAQNVTNTVGIKLRLIPAGEFLMGTPEGVKDKGAHEQPQQKVNISRPFYMGMTEITQGQWEAVVGTTPWKGKPDIKEGADYPATYIAWNQTLVFCKKLGKKEGATYRLPTEAEWEYACRAGTTTAFYFGDDGSELGTYDTNHKN